jgi:glycosyltransferase involved in cell wall biosynthesis
MPQFDAAKISIVTCSYQQGAYLDATIRSVLDQNIQGLEYIIIDGGSKDGSVELIRRYEDKLAYWVSEKDRGQTDALIKGFKRSTAEIQGWLCSDDLLLSGALQKVIHFFDTHPHIDAVYGDALWIDAHGSYIRPKREMGFNRFAFLFDHNYIPQPSMFWRSRLYEKVGGLNKRFNLAMDSDLWERFSRHTKMAHISEYLSCMRYYPEQKTRALRPIGMIEDAQIRGRACSNAASVLPFLKPVAKTVRIVNKFLAGGYFSNPSDDVIASLDKYRIVENSQ